MIGLLLYRKQYILFKQLPQPPPQQLPPPPPQQQQQQPQPQPLQPLQLLPQQQTEVC